MDKKKIKIIFIVVLSILVVAAGITSGYIYWKKYGKKTEGFAGDYSKSRLIYLKADRLRILDEKYNIWAEARFVNKYSKFKIMNSNFVVFTGEEGNIAVADISKGNEIKVTDEQKKLEKSGHRHIFVFNGGFIGVLSDNGIYSEEKGESRGISGKEIVKIVKDSSINFYKIDKKGKISDAVFENIRPLVKTGKYITLDANDYYVYFDKSDGNKIKDIIEKTNIRDNNFCEIKDDKIKLYDVAEGKYPKKIVEMELDKNSFGVTENGEIAEILTVDNGVIFKQYEFNKESKQFSIKSEIKGSSASSIEVIKLIDNKLFFTVVDGKGINTELNFVDFEDVEAGVQNISSIDYETIKYIAKRNENRYMFAEGNSLFEIDLSKRKVESGKAAYEKVYKTKYIDSFVKSSKNEIYTAYNDNKKLYIEKNDFNKVTEFMQIEGITANSVDIYLKQVEENSRGEKIALWNKLLSNGTNAKDYKSIITKISENKNSIGVEEIKGLEYSKTGKEASSNIIYDKGRIYYVALETLEVAPMEEQSLEENMEEAEDESIEIGSESYASGAGATTITTGAVSELPTTIEMSYLYVADDNLKVIEKYEILSSEAANSILKDENSIYIVGSAGIYIFDMSKKEIRKAAMSFYVEGKLSLIKSRNKLFVFEKRERWNGKEWESTGKMYEIGKLNGEKINEYSFEGKKIKQVRAYEDKIVVADGKDIKVYTEELKPIDNISLKENINFMEISGCRVYVAGTYMELAEINLETSEVMSEKYIPNLQEADCIKVLFMN